MITKNVDLNKIFNLSDRSSVYDDEGKYYEIFRRAPNFSVISGGQTGVDSLGLQAGTVLGLPCFSVMPLGCRKEIKTESEYEPYKIIGRVIELGSESYRYRTYANVYFCDVTLIWDFCDSDGTKACVLACEKLNKKYLLVKDTRQAIEFLLKNRPKVINIAGNTGNKLSLDTQRQVFNEILKILKNYATSFGRGIISEKDKVTNKDKIITIGVPNFYQAKELFSLFIKQKYDIDLRFDKRLTYSFLNYKAVLARPRDLIKMLSLGLDAIFVGEDLLQEYNVRFATRFDSGLIPNSTVMVAKKGINNYTTCVSQYYNIAKKYIDGLNLNIAVKEINGGAEGWINSGFADLAIDTLQTGNTIDANEIEYIKTIMITNLNLVTYNYKKTCSLFSDFISWLNN